MKPHSKEGRSSVNFFVLCRVDLELLRRIGTFFLETFCIERYQFRVLRLDDALQRIGDIIELCCVICRFSVRKQIESAAHQCCTALQDGTPDIRLQHVIGLDTGAICFDDGRPMVNDVERHIFKGRCIILVF